VTTLTFLGKNQQKLVFSFLDPPSYTE